jgi:hypothetical protein
MEDSELKKIFQRPRKRNDSLLTKENKLHFQSKIN